MSIVYKILFNNKSGQDGVYAFFVGAPHSENPSGRAFSNVWISTFIPNEGDHTIETTSQFYAWTGNAPQPLTLGVVMHGVDARPASLASNKAAGSDFPVSEKFGACRLGNDLRDCSAPGAFSLTTDQTVSPNSDPAVGAAQIGTNGKMVPTYSVSADPGMRYQFQPVAKYYVARGDYTPGTCVEVNAESLNPCTIDFSRSGGMTSAVVTANEDGTCTTQFR